MAIAFCDGNGFAGIDHLHTEQLVRPFGVPNGGRRLTRHREPTQSVQCSGPGVKGVEGLKGFSASVSPPSLNSLHFSPREAVEKNHPHCSPLLEIPLGALDPEVESLALNYPPVEGQKPFIGAGQAEEQRQVELAHRTDVVSIRRVGGAFHDW